MTVTTVTTDPLAQVQADTSDLFGELVQDWHTGRRLWARGSGRGGQHQRRRPVHKVRRQVVRAVR